LYPEAIFVLDVSPEVGMRRDNNKKALNWLQKTRENYLHSANSIVSKKIRFQIIAEDITIEEKNAIVVSYLRKRM
jgi:thymidylate kinase